MLSIASSLVDRTDVEASDQTVLQAEDMADFPVRQKLAAKIAHGLADLDGDLAVGTDREIRRVEMGIDHSPLAHPVLAHAVAPPHMATILAVGPHHVTVQAGQHAIDVAGIEAL